MNEVWFSVITGVLGYAYFGHPALLVVLGSFMRSPKSHDLTELPIVSLLIVAYNEEEVIRGCLPKSGD